MTINAERVRGDYCEDRGQAGGWYRAVAQALECRDRRPQEFDERPTLPWDQHLFAWLPVVCLTLLGTYKQMTELGGHVRKGERGSPVIFWRLLEGEDKEGKAKTVPVCRYYTVFNVEQCEGINHKRLDEIARPKPSQFSPIERAEALVKGYPNPPSIRTDATAAYYRPSTDSVVMPPPETFESAEAFYSVLFHELSHSTGAKSRLAREGVTDPQRFGNHEYSKEELIAEMSASFLRAFAAIDSEPLVDNSAAYLASWLRVLRKDARMVIYAAAAAQRAVDHIRGVKAADEAEATTDLKLAA